MFPLCLNTSTIMPRPLREKVEVAARAGYDLIELWSADVEAFVQEGGALSTLCAHLRHSGLAVPSMIALTGWGEMDEQGFAQYLRTTAAARMETAALLGCPRIVASPPVRTTIPLPVVGARYAALLDLGARIGVRPVMEFLGFVPQIHGVRPCLEVLAYANDPRASIVLDPFHIFRGGGGFEDVLLVPGYAVGICHFNDAPGDKPREAQQDADRVQPGEGVLPLGDLVRSLRAIGYHGPISLELFNRALWERDPALVVSDGLARMRRILQEA